MKKNVFLHRLAKIANKLDDLKCHKESSAITAIMCKLAQYGGDGLGWSLPAGAENDPNAPYNQDDSGYNSISDYIDKIFKTEFIPELKEYYFRLLQITHEALQSKGASWNDAKAREQSIQDIYNIDPFFEQGEKAWNTFAKKIIDTFGKQGLPIAEDAAEKFSDFAMQHQTPETFIQSLDEIAEKIIEPHFDDIANSKYENMLYSD